MKKIVYIILLNFSIVCFSQTNNPKLSQSEIKSFILKETSEGGKLDFFSSIKGKERDGSQIKPGVYASNIEIALYRWGKANLDLGVENFETALTIFEEHKGRNATAKEKSLIKMGFQKELE